MIGIIILIILILLMDAYLKPETKYSIYASDFDMRAHLLSLCHLSYQHEQRENTVELFEYSPLLHREPFYYSLVTDEQGSVGNPLF